MPPCAARVTQVPTRIEEVHLTAPSVDRAHSNRAMAVSSVSHVVKDIITLIVALPHVLLVDLALLARTVLTWRHVSQ